MEWIFVVERGIKCCLKIEFAQRYGLLPSSEAQQQVQKGLQISSRLQSTFCIPLSLTLKRYWLILIGPPRYTV